MNKHFFKQLTYTLIFLSHLAFLADILIDKIKYTAAIFLVPLAFHLLVKAYKNLPLQAKDESLGHLLTIVFVFFGALVTFLLQTNFHLNPVLAAAIVGFCGSFLPKITKENLRLRDLPNAIYCGAFVGMTDILLVNYLFLAVASVLAGLLLIGSKNAFRGLGGKLGTVAFSGVLISFFFTYFLTK